MRYCKKCLNQDTRPELEFDEEGVCAACRNYEARPAVNWHSREAELRNTLERYRSKDGSNYDSN